VRDSVRVVVRVVVRVRKDGLSLVCMLEVCPGLLQCLM
jgi:hypothetical protein